MPQLGKLDFGALFAAILSLVAAAFAQLPDQVGDILILIAGGGLGAFGLLGGKGEAAVGQLREHITSDAFIEQLAERTARRVQAGATSIAVLILAVGVASGCGGGVIAATPPDGHVSSTLQGEYEFEDGETDGRLDGKLDASLASSIEFNDGAVVVPYEFTVRADASLGDGAQFEVCFDSPVVIAIVRLFTGQPLPDVLCASVPIGDRNTTSSLSPAEADALAAAALSSLLEALEAGSVPDFTQPPTASRGDGSPYTLATIGDAPSPATSGHGQLLQARSSIPDGGHARHPRAGALVVTHEALAFANGCGSADWNAVPDSSDDDDASTDDDDPEPTATGSGDQSDAGDDTDDELAE